MKYKNVAFENSQSVPNRNDSIFVNLPDLFSLKPLNLQHGIYGTCSR